MKDFIGERVGPKHVIPTYWVGTDLTTVDWATVPLPAVVKPTHASGAGYFLNSQEDIEVLMKRRPEKEWLALDHYKFNREWAYKDVPRQIIIEKMLGCPGERLTDYRFYCFDGEPAHIEIRTPKSDRMFEAVYAPDWQLLDIHMDFYPLLREPLPRPARLDKMLEIVRKIGSGIRFARIDLYDTQEGPFVGEITLYPSGI
ncbi:ATP-grasp fold amidoligase family protein [Roseibium salinum]|uniref:ATP-grasp fold amidoligase family protein n=1 Tax=Roseibium salinum TaxID=1604349 RepID=UPI00360835D5